LYFVFLQPTLFFQQKSRINKQKQINQKKMAETSVRRKLVMVGFRGVGKSSLAMQFVDGKTPNESDYTPTIEQTFQKNVTINNVRFKCDLVDTAGMDEYSSFTRQASVGAHGYMFVYAITSKASFEKLKQVHENLLNLIGNDNVPMVLVAQKGDLSAHREVSEEEGRQLAVSWSCPFIQTSAKLNLNVGDCFNSLIRQIEKDSQLLEPPKKTGGCVIL
jgi:Ras family protein